ncbi:NAD-dependent epimerase/dehydratase family protein [Bradyrhizobium sp. AUGA SZCCT0169]|uniref:NAD-dependent epimerase/dehydratase family protein n=1 Tax=Bradyrhizobium sp. AUGA SZCCT0169 TaxID=2807663 RepID=UPI001BA9F731|nr:NAD-dependent epimerase/dehydratase family protein [Bradyrhizobium sp. AUGA SZCCT0169]MBR1249464.1 NAD-dependent epimerase/dehydratase family protein [Bradyrhizobium sp. AUGA SZCCT0169]
MNVWVTGANGFIGRHLVRVLADRGYRVHGIGHGAIEDAEKRRTGLEHWLNGEIDAANLNTLASQSGLPSTIFHLAGGSSVGLSIAQPFEDFSRTVAGTARLLEWLRGSARDCRLIVASSAAVYGAGHEGAIAVDAAVLPMSPYGQHKLMMEQLCRSYAVTFGLRSTVVRLFSVYGPYLRKQLPWDICSRLHAGERNLVLGGTGVEVRDWTDVRDVVRLFAQIGGRPQPETFHVINAGSGLGTTVANIAAMLAKSWDGGISLEYSGAVRAGDPPSLLADDATLRALRFDWKIPVEQGLADYVSWFREQAR